MSYREKLVTASNLIKEKYPELADELFKTAQNLEGFEMPQNNQGMNPNIETFAKPGQSSEQRELHKLTLQLDVPAGTDELHIMNNLLPKLKQLEDSDYKLKGYAFDERTRG